MEYHSFLLNSYANIIILLTGFCIGFYTKGLFIKTIFKNLKQHMIVLEQQISTLQQENATMRATETKRLKEIASRRRYYEENDISDTENQIKFINQAKLYPVRPVNKEAAQVLYALDKWITVNRPDWRISFEVAMGAFIKTSYDSPDQIQKAAFSSYNSKRVDFLLIDKFGHPKLAVEYHGTGHDLSEDASNRMKVKRLVLNRVGIPLLEIPAKISRSEISLLVTEKIDMPLTTEHR